MDCFDFPVFLLFNKDGADRIDPVVVFDYQNDRYQLLSCIPVWKPNDTDPDPTFYSSYILNATYEIFASDR
ncbi:MAG: hypothetical protein WDN75_09920 [Bacteroidota bacterium]